MPVYARLSSPRPNFRVERKLKRYAIEGRRNDGTFRAVVSAHSVEEARRVARVRYHLDPEFTVAVQPIGSS